MADRRKISELEFVLVTPETGDASLEIRTDSGDLRNSTVLGILADQLPLGDIEQNALDLKANDNRVIRRFRPELYGAVGDGTTNDTAALVATFAAMSPGDVLELPTGKIYAHNAVLTISTPGISLIGRGELRATTEATSAVKIAANNVTVSDVLFTCPTTT